MAPFFKNWFSRKSSDEDNEGSQPTSSVKYGKWWVTGATFGTLTLSYFTDKSLIFKPTSANLETCLKNVCGSRSDCARFSGERTFEYYTEWVRPLNLARESIPTAVIRPTTAEEIGKVVQCAAKNNVKVQARSGGHSYANHGLGGENGAVSIDMVNFQYVNVNTSDPSGNVRVGAGTRLGTVDELLGPHGRAFAHGVCPGVGIGGHATIGGLGPMSRMWGSCLDHIEEVEVVIANGTVLRASTLQNQDLFFALRGAAAGFGIITEFVMRTHPAPKDVIHYTYNFQYSHLAQMAEFFDEWQALVSDPTLDHRLGTEFMLYPLGARVTATWYGTKAELYASKIIDRLPSGNDSLALTAEDWGQSLINRAVQEALYFPDIPNKFFSKSLGFTRADAIPKGEIEDLFRWVEQQDKGTSVWFIIFDATGGAVSQVPMKSTAYAHRDKFMFYQSYAVNALQQQQRGTQDFLDNFHSQILNRVPNGTHGTYPGYVDPDLRDPQQAYWMSNLPVLEEIKSTWDPTDIFHNPQSVRPSAKSS
ncbi:FAD-linked oxidoreductase sorD [Colletotrichum siamense]|nr:FAD-linked oxidoreductase sorD [Colletotrichum siamense]